MTGTTDLSVEQLRAIAKHSEREDDIKHLVRVVIHPAADKAVRVVTRHLCFGDVLEGHFYVLRNGEVLTGREFDEYEGERVRST